VGLYWEEYQKPGYNPVQNKAVVATRLQIKVDEELLIKDAYEEFMYRMMNKVIAS
jgi:tRNA(His) guanylyltransferase